jgi:8-oxo-dGTP diphosphatase
VIELAFSDETLTLDSTATDPDELIKDLVRLAESAFTDGVHRIQAVVPEDDLGGRRALFRAAFRLEGRRREATTGADGRIADELIFSRLSTDKIGGAYGFSAIANSIMARKRLIAHVLIRDRDDRVLLCETTFKTDWELPGGIVEAGEPPRHGAIREIQEELGVAWDPGPLLAIDWMPPYLGWEDACELIFDGGVIAEDDLEKFTLDQREIKRTELIALPDAESRLTPLSFRRLTAILAAEPGRTLIMEDGRPL